MERRTSQILNKRTKFTGGRNNNGRITCIWLGSKHKYRIIDFYRKRKIPATVDRIEYDPKRTAYIALITYKDGEKLILFVLKV